LLVEAVVVAMAAFMALVEAVVPAVYYKERQL
jgi:hypothetical protein